MNVNDFPSHYKLKMIRAYPTIAKMDADEEFLATPEERDEAFARILANQNLRRTHEMFLEELGL
jgi:GTP-sensing pleiotropic transcriptional regulator CodY